MTQGKWKSLASMAALGMFLTIAAHGATITVPGDQPTIQAGIDAATNGDTVLVSNGTYYEVLTISGKTITLASNYINSSNESDITSTILDGNSKAITPITVANDVGANTKIIGFTIRDGDDGISCASKINIEHNYFTGNSDAIDYEGGGGLCAYNVFENNTDDAVDLDGACEATVEYNTIKDNNDDGIEIRFHAYSGTTLNIIIRNNTITGNGEDGIQLIDYPDVSSRVFRIERNLIADNAMVGIGCMSNGNTTENYEAASIPERVYLINNTFAGNGYGLTGGDNFVVLNNVFMDTTNIAIKNCDGSSITSYCIFYNNGTNYTGTNIDSPNIVLQDPDLDANYEPTSAVGPTVDAGTAYFEWPPPKEVLLNLDPGDYSGSAPDLGVYEWEGGDPPDNPWVDFNYSGLEVGTQLNPFDTLAEGLIAVVDAGTIYIKAGTSSETLTINQNVRLEADSPTVRIGVLGGKSGEAKAEEPPEGAGDIGYAEDLPSDSTSYRPGIVELLRRLLEALLGTSEVDEIENDGTTYEPVLPFTMADEGTHAAQVDSPLAVRLRSEAEIDPASIWGPIPGYGEDEAIVEWQPVREGDLRDIWVIFRPQETWYLKDLIELTVGARTVSGDALESSTYTFQVESEAELEARASAAVEPLWQPQSEEEGFEPEAAPVEAESVGELLDEGVDVPFSIEPEQVYETPQRVWLPVPPGVSPDDAQLYYYHPNEPGRGWYPAENVEGWLVPDSYLYLEVEGTTYLGFLVRHAGIVQLGIPSEKNE